MPFRNRNRLRPINSIKHIVDQQLTVPAGGSSPVIILVGAENPVTTVANEIKIGAKVSTIFLNIQVVNSTNATGLINNAYFYIYVNPGGNIVGTARPAVNAVGTSNLRKMVFHQEMAMLSDANDSIPITLFKGVLKIPRKAQRIGIGDEIEIQVGTPAGGAEIDACIQCIYKEYN